MKSPRTILGIALVLLVNILALIGVARNRAGDPVQTIELTERELPLQTMGQDNSGVMLRLAWSAPPFRSPEPELDRAKLETAGFSLQFPAGSQSKDITLMPREAYVALEYVGAAWVGWLKQAEEQKKNNQFENQRPVGVRNANKEPIGESHLCAVDVSRSWTELRSRYPDQSRVLIVRAVLTARLEDVTEKAGGAVISINVYGSVSEILPSMINVPKPYAGLLSPLKPRTGPEPRYSVTLKYGRNLEPWVAGVRLR